MNRLRRLVVALAVAGAAIPALPLNPTAAVADTGTPSLAQLQQQLAADEAKLTDLNDQFERAQGKMDELNRKLVADAQQEQTLDKQLAAMGRLEYEQPSFTLTTILEARSLEQLLTNVAQARLVAHKQRNVLGQARDLHQQDEQARGQMQSEVARVQKARDDAAAVANRTKALVSSAQDAAVRAKAAVVSAAASAVQTAPGPATGTYPNHFAYGYCTFYVASRRYVPWFGNAIEWWPNAAAYGFAEGQAPRVGAIMVTRESAVGHVAYVEAVHPDGGWDVSEENFAGWNIVSRRSNLHAGQIPLVGFIY
jgi:surface antigen